MDRVNYQLQKKIKDKTCRFSTIFALCLAMATLFSGCHQGYKGSDEAVVDGAFVDKILGVSIKDTIVKISISTLPPSEGLFENLEITDPEDIKTIVDYFNGIHTTKTKKNQNEYYGMAYLLVFQSDENKTIEVNFFGNMFITVNKQTKEVPYDEAIVFDSVISNIISKQYRDDKTDNLPVGKVTGVSIEDDGESRKRICMIDTSNDKIEIGDSYIFDTTTNSGWSNLHKGDQVEVYLRENTKIADVIFITKN